MPKGYQVSEATREKLRVARTIHGGHGSPTYISWRSMKARCLNANATGYENYGGRGITVYSAWLNFANFLADMGERPKGTSLDRIDVNGNYEPGNVRWADESLQHSNIRKSPPKRCTVEGCEKALIAKDLCQMHYARLKKFDSLVLPDRPRPVCVLCGAVAHGRGLCQKHYDAAKYESQKAVIHAD